MVLLTIEISCIGIEAVMHFWLFYVEVARLRFYFSTFISKAICIFR